MKLTLTIPPDLLSLLDELRGDRKYQAVIIEQLHRATQPDPRLLVLEAALAAKDEEIARLHETLRALTVAPVLPSPPPTAVLAEPARIDSW